MNKDLVRCPFCAEEIRPEAIICRWCGSTIPKDELSKPISLPENKPEILPLLPIKGEGVNWRFNAFFFDSIIILFIYGLVMVLLGIISEGVRIISDINKIDYSSIFGGIALVSIPIIWFLYHFVSEGTSSTTIGKKLSHLSIIKKDGGKISWGQAAVRSFLSIFEDNIIAPLCIWMTRNNQRIADLLVGTLVVNREKLQQIEFRPTSAVFCFHDYRRVEFAQIQKASLHKFGMVQHLKIQGTGLNGHPLKLTIHGQFQRSQLDILKNELIQRYQIFIPERIIVWRLLLTLGALVLLILGIAMTIYVTTLQ
jgi:uncharacterized RDD family membrane protein YckC